MNTDRSEYIRQWRANNKEKVLASKRVWQAANREATRNHVRTYRKRHPEKARNASATKRARKLNATPTWLSEDQRQEINMIYKQCPEGYQVDHIYPLAGRTICGLHVPWNLQYLTIEDNLKKGNKLVALDGVEPSSHS